MPMVSLMNLPSDIVHDVCVRVVSLGGYAELKGVCKAIDGMLDRDECAVAFFRHEVKWRQNLSMAVNVCYVAIETKRSIVADAIMDVYGRRVLLAGVMEMAAKRNDRDMLKLCVDQNVFTYDGALATAAEGGHVDTCEYLISLGATDLDSALFAAASHGHTAVCQLLIDKGATDVDAALMGGVAGDNAAACELLLRNGASDHLMLHGAAYGGRVDVCEDILRRTPNEELQAQYEWGLVGAACGRHVHLCKWFVELGATHFELALLAAADGGCVETCTYLIDVCKAYGIGAALARAASAGHVDVCRFLISRGLSPDTVVSAILAAARHGHRNVCEHLRDATPPDTGFELAACAAENAGFLDVSRMLRASR
jgi:hypothetical protein